MQTRLLPAILALFVLCSAAVAQDYRIRTDANINLRNSYSLESAIFETVPSGTVLQVVGRFNRWLKIDRNGNTVWMADWVPYTRLAAGEQTQAGTDAQAIDNCCFVDRQCSADADWVSGYQAFQQGQCPVPVQTRQQTPLQTTTTDTSQIDNCCFVDRQCSSDEEWVSGYWAFQQGQCPVPVQTPLQSTTTSGSQGLIIEGPPDFVAKFEEALAILESKTPEWYAYAISGLDRIREVGGSNIQRVRASDRTLNISRKMVFLPEPNQERIVGDLATMLVFYACQIHRYEAGIRTSNQPQEEKACFLQQLEADRIVNPDTVWLLENFINSPHAPWNS